nr:MAG TPA: hypothetical protein [Bacteriophage sp.]
MVMMLIFTYVSPTLLNGDLLLIMSENLHG